MLEFNFGRSRLAFKIDNGYLSGEFLSEDIKCCDTLIRKHDGTRPTDMIYFQDSYNDTSPNRVTLRPTEFFAKHYDNEDPVFNPTFSTPIIDSRKSRFSKFNAPVNRTLRSPSPNDRPLMRIMEEKDEDLKSERIGAKVRNTIAPAPVRYSSQVRFDNQPTDSNFGKRTFDYDSPRSLGRISDSFHNFNRFTNQPNQRGTQRTAVSRFMDDEIVRLNRYTHLKNSNKKKSLADMVDEVILEKESIYFNPDNQPITTKAHDFHGDTPSRGTMHSRATFDPYDISSVQERQTTSNQFKFKTFWDKSKKDNNMTFGSVAPKPVNSNFSTVERATIGDRFGSFSPMRDTHSATSRKLPPRDSKIGIEKDINSHSKSQKKMDNVSVSHLSQMSNHYYDDQDRRIMQRYYLLMHGEPTAIDAQFSFNIFKKSDNEKTDLRISVIIRHVYFEYTNDWIKNIAKAVLGYKLENIHNRVYDVTIKPDPKEYQRKIEFHTVIMYLTKRNFENYKKELRKPPQRTNLDEPADPDYEEEEEWKSRKQYKQDKKIQKQLIEVDKMIKNVNFKINFKLDEFRLDALTDIDGIR